jgi:hypothetical protein
MSEPRAQNTSGGSKLDGPSSCDGRHWPPPYGPPVLPPPPEKNTFFLSAIIGRFESGKIISHTVLRNRNRNFCLSGTGTVINYGSGYDNGTGTVIKWNHKRKEKMR